MDSLEKPQDELRHDVSASDPEYEKARMKKRKENEGNDDVEEVSTTTIADSKELEDFKR